MDVVNIDGDNDEGGYRWYQIPDPCARLSSVVREVKTPDFRLFNICLFWVWLLFWSVHFMEVIKDKGFRPQYDQSLVVMLTQVIIDHYIIWGIIKMCKL